jgi:glycosyltransferase involved in cell wall biosynthesis
MKVAIVHDWFNDEGGAEKVVREIVACFPDADIYCLFDFFNEEQRKKYLLGKPTKRSFIQHIPMAKKFYRFLFPIFPIGIERFNLSAYDLIISSSSCVAKGVKKTDKQLHICYCHSPVRYAWDLKNDYLAAVHGYLVKKVFNHFLNRLNRWDYNSSKRVDYFIANSNNVKKRILENYVRESVVIYPPVNISAFTFIPKKRSYYFTIARLVAYKKTKLIVRAFAQMPHLQLEVGGAGPNLNRLKRMATPNITMLGYIDSKTKKEKIENAKAFIGAANEDFGITMVEAQASGTPVIVPYIGGYIETVLETTGLFYKNQTVEDIIEAVTKFEAQQREFKLSDFKNNVERFNVSRFQKEFLEFVNERYSLFLASGGK